MAVHHCTLLSCSFLHFQLRCTMVLWYVGLGSVMPRSQAVHNCALKASEVKLQVLASSVHPTNYPLEKGSFVQWELLDSTRSTRLHLTPHDSTRLHTTPLDTTPLAPLDSTRLIRLHLTPHDSTRHDSTRSTWLHLTHSTPLDSTRLHLHTTPLDSTWLHTTSTPHDSTWLLDSTRLHSTPHETPLASLHSTPLHSTLLDSPSYYSCSCSSSCSFNPLLSDSIWYYNNDHIQS